MSRNIKVAALQMDASPAPTADRLQRAGKLVGEAAQAGAQLVVLPKISYLSSDFLLPLLTIPVYRRGLRRIRGKNDPN